MPSVAFHRLLEAGAAAEAHASFVRAKREQAEEVELRKVRAVYSACVLATSACPACTHLSLRAYQPSPAALTSRPPRPHQRFRKSSAFRTMKRERDVAVSKWIIETISKRDAGRVTSWLRVVCATNAAVVLGGAVLLARRRKEAKRRMDAMLAISFVIKPKINKYVRCDRRNRAAKSLKSDLM